MSFDLYLESPILADGGDTFYLAECFNKTVK